MGRRIRIRVLPAVDCVPFGHQRLDVAVGQESADLVGVVVPKDELDDPLILDPPRIVGGDYRDGTVIIRLSQPLNSRWKQALQNMGNYRSVMGAEPERWQISGNEVRLSIRQDLAQNVVDIFKEWVPQANQVYATGLRNERRRAEEERLAAEQATREKLRKESEVRGKLRF
jgi:hypothetical protein